MLAWSLIKRIKKACVCFVSNGIDYVRYIVEEIRNTNRPDWREGELRGVINELHEHPAAQIPHTTGKINVRIS